MLLCGSLGRSETHVVGDNLNFGGIGFTDQVSEYGADKRCHTTTVSTYGLLDVRRNDNDGDTVTLAPLVKRLESRVEGNVYLSDHRKGGHTLNQDLFAFIERVVGSNARQHVPERVAEVALPREDLGVVRFPALLERSVILRGVCRG